MTISAFSPSAFNRRKTLSARQSQSGVALAVALVILIVITLLGVTAIRRAQLQSRLSQNAEATVLARGTASVNANAITNDEKQFPLTEGFSTCWISKVPATQVQPGAAFNCSDVASATSPLGAFAAALPSTEKAFSYFMVKRETPSSLPTSSFRSANLSGVAYEFASFSMVSGFDASNNNDGVAEVSQTLLQPTASPPGVTQQTFP